MERGGRGHYIGEVRNCGATGISLIPRASTGGCGQARGGYIPRVAREAEDDRVGAHLAARAGGSERGGEGCGGRGVALRRTSWA